MRIPALALAAVATLGMMTLCAAADAQRRAANIVVIVADAIGETMDLAGRHPEPVKELAQEWQQWTKQLAPPRWPPPGPQARGAPEPGS